MVSLRKSPWKSLTHLPDLMVYSRNDLHETVLPKLEILDSLGMSQTIRPLVYVYCHRVLS